MNANSEYYKVFHHVYAHSSPTAVVQELYISQPAVSQTIRQLKKEAGTELFLHTSKGARLTREGEFLYHYVESGMEELLEGGKTLERMLDVDVGGVRIGVNNMTSQSHLLPYLEQFHREYPKIGMDITNTLTPGTIKNLEKGRTDFEVMTSPLTSRGIVRQFRTKIIRSVFIAGNSFRELKGRKLEHKELEAFPCIAPEKNASTRTFMDAFLAQQGILLKPESELTISDMIVQFARRNMGIGCIMEGFTKDATVRGEIFRLKFKQEMPLRYMCVVAGESGLISMPGRKLSGMVACDQAVTERPAGGRQQKMNLLQEKDISNTHGKHNK